MNHEDVIVEEILNRPENNPINILNICTALLMNTTKEDQQILQQYATEKEWAKFGLAIYSISFKRQERMAESEAAEFFNQLIRGNHD